MVEGTSPPIRVLIADDHPVVRLGLASLCSARPDLHVCGEASTGVEAVLQFDRLLPDVAVFDLRMPEMDGIEAMIAVHRQHPQARVLILSTFDAAEEIYQAIAAGARGYLLKQFMGDELASGIRAVHSGGHCIPPAVAVRLAERGVHAALSQREIEVMSLVSKGLTNPQIAAQLSIAPVTVRNHLVKVFEKLGASNRAEAVVIALERGILRLA